MPSGIALFRPGRPIWPSAKLRPAQGPRIHLRSLYSNRRRAHKEGRDALRQALAEYERAGTHVWTLYALALFAETLLTAGESDEATPVLAQGAALLERLGSHFYQAEVLRLQGEALLVAGARPAAERYFMKALDAARAQLARALELRAAMSLAQSQKYDGRQSEERELLKRAIGDFPDEDGNHYLEEARTFLQKL